MPVSRRLAAAVLGPLLAAAGLTAAAPAAAGVALAAPGAATAQDYVPGEVVVRYEPGTPRAERRAVQLETGTGRPEPLGGGTRVLQVTDGESVSETVRELARSDAVAAAAPNLVARASAFVPNDPGRGGPRDWQDVQWNFLAQAGVNAPEAWTNARAAGQPGGRGVTVAVLDTGVAYANRGRFRRSPDFTSTRFVRGYDFVERDRFPNDEFGHGTYVAGLVAESTNNGRALTGLAYRASIMPVRVLDENGEGDAAVIERGIRFAARRNADVINLSLEFGPQVRAAEIPGIIDALRDAARKGVLIVASAGNEGDAAVAYPSRAGGVISVGATTDSRCLAEYSNGGRGLDIVAPGGGSDAPLDDDANCRPLSDSAGREIFQLTFTAGDPRRFGLRGESGTSMAAAHVTGVAALVLGAGILGPDPRPTAVEQHLEATARDLGPPGPDSRYGAGLLDAASATAPR